MNYSTEKLVQEIYKIISVLFTEEKMPESNFILDAATKLENEDSNFDPADVDFDELPHLLRNKVLNDYKDGTYFKAILERVIDAQINN